MEMGEQEAPRLTTSNTSCCVTSQAPLPESKTELLTITTGQELTAIPIPAHQVVISANIRFTEVPLNLSPPSLRSLLCTFLI
jgi:hypothetical protein